MDCIHLNGIRVYGYVGYLPEEQVLGQWFEVDVTLWLDLSKAGHSDRIEDTHNYRSTVEVVQELIETRKFKLIETLVEAIAQAILQNDRRIEQTRVRLTKLSPPIPNYTGTVSVEITRMATAVA